MNKKKYLVTVSQKTFATLAVEAHSIEEAREIARTAARKREVEFVRRQVEDLPEIYVIVSEPRPEEDEVILEEDTAYVVTHNPKTAEEYAEEFKDMHVEVINPMENFTKSFEEAKKKNGKVY